MYGLINLSFGKSQINAEIKITIDKDLNSAEVICIIQTQVRVSTLLWMPQARTPRSWSTISLELSYNKGKQAKTFGHDLIFIFSCYRDIYLYF